MSILVHMFVHYFVLFYLTIKYNRRIIKQSWPQTTRKTNDCTVVSQPSNLCCITNIKYSIRSMTKVEIHNGAESKACDRIIKCTRLDTWKVSSVPKSYATVPVFPSLEYMQARMSPVLSRWWPEDTMSYLFSHTITHWNCFLTKTAVK